MPNYFCHLWSKPTFEFQSGYSTKKQKLNHAASNMFKQVGVKPGDIVYVWSFFGGTLYVIGRMTVGKIVDQKTSEKICGGKTWEADDHIIASKCTSQFFDVVVPDSKIKDIQFIKMSGDLSGVAYFDDGSVNWQTFRGARQITAQTAKLLDDALAKKG